MSDEIKYTIDDLIRDCNKYHKTLKDIRNIANEIAKQKVHDPDVDIILTKIHDVLKV